MRTVFRATVAASMALVATAGHAAQTAQAGACLTLEEAQGLFISIAPDMVRSIAKTCAPALPAGAYLRARSGTLADRYALPAEAAKPAAMAAIGKLSGEKILPLEMFQFVSEGVIAAVAEEKIKPQDCSKIDRALELLDPLPPANLAGLITLFVEMAGSDGKKAPPITICKPA